MRTDDGAFGGMHMPKAYHNKLIKAVLQFGLIEDSDKVLVGFSGGKDSAFLMYALKCLKEHFTLDFELGSVTVDIGFEAPLDEAGIAAFARKVGVPHGFVRTRAYETIKARSEESPCAWCSYFRRACVNSFAKENGYNKVAYAHHMDDAIETLLMNMLYSGRAGTFLPRTELSRSGVSVIRPLIYFSEKEVRRSLKFMGFTPIPNPCPYERDTCRAKVKELVRSLDMENRMVRRNLEAVVKAGLVGQIVSEGPDKARKSFPGDLYEEH